MNVLAMRRKYWIDDYLQGSPMWNDFQDALTILENPSGTLSHRRDLLSDMLRFASENVGFYSNINATRLRDFPVVNKNSYVSNSAAFLVPLDKVPGQIGEMHIQKTSGSTGTPLVIPQDTRCRVRRLALIKAANTLVGFQSFEPLMHLRAVKHYWGFPDDLTFKDDLNILYADNANLTTEKVDRIVRAINDYGIKFVRGYMTTINTITEYAVEKGIELKTHPTFISGGELLLEKLRSRIVNDLKCHVVSQYANEENGIIGQSRLDDVGVDMSLFLANCYVEILKLDSDDPAEKGELGRIVVTDYTNHAMPMIRYDTGDLAKADEVTEDGEVLSIKALAGRKTDIIYCTNGSPIDLWNSMPPAIYNNPLVRQWQFVQSGEKDYKVIISASDESIGKYTDRFVDLMRLILGADAGVTFEYVSEIPVLNSGKRKVIIQAWKK